MRQAERTEEACRIAECLAVFLRRSGLPDNRATEIAQDLRISAVELREKHVGRVDSRLNVKKTGNPLLEGRKSNHLYLDESGTASSAADDQVFALGGVVLHEEDVDDYIRAADEIKLRYFGRTDVVFHEPLMRKHDKIFGFLGDLKKRAEFDAAFRQLVVTTPFKAFGVGIRKERFKQEFLDLGCDPYLPTKVYDLAIMLMLERYVDYLATNMERRLGRVHFESIGAREDAEHQAAYADLLLHGTQFVSEKMFQSWVETGCRFDPKRGSHPAELADLVAREMFEWTRSDCKVEPPFWSELRSKIYCRDDGYYSKFGVKVFPAADLADEIEAHRVACGAIVKN